MKYYAVTDDPTELLHYGVKGMKWGEHLFGDDLKPKSSAYKKAESKLRASSAKQVKAPKSVKMEPVKKTAAQKSFDVRAKQQDQFNKAVRDSQTRIKAIENLNRIENDRRAQASEKRARADKNKFNNAVKSANTRIKIIENLNKVDNQRDFERRLNKEYKREMRIERDNEKQRRVDEKRERRYAKNERKMEKYMEQARQGKLKYGKLSDDQVREITDRLGIERNARVLGSAEKTWKQQKKDAFRQGKLQGITRGTAAAMEEVARAGVQYGIRNWRNRRKLDKQNERDAERQHEASRIRNKKSRSEMREDFRDEVYEQRVREGDIRGTKGLAETKRRLDDAEHKRLRERNTQDRIDSEMQLINDSEYQSALDRQREKRRRQDVQDRLANERDENWQRYLDENGLTDEQARSQRFLDSSKTSTINVDGEEITVFDKKKSKGTSGDPRAVEALNNGNIESAGSVEQQRQKILNENDRKEYKQYLDNERLKEEKEQQEIIEKRTERENKRIEEAEKWNKEEEKRFSKEHAQYENDLAEFNKYERLRESSPEMAIIMYPSGGPKKPKEPERPKYKNTTFNDDVTKLPTVYNPSGVMTFSEWRREKYSKNQNGKKKNNNNNKNGGGGNR